MHLTPPLAQRPFEVELKENRSHLLKSVFLLIQLIFPDTLLLDVDALVSVGTFSNKSLCYG